MLSYDEIYSGKNRTIAETKALIRKHCPHVGVRWNRDYREFRLAYLGLKPEREEAMAQYIELPQYLDGTDRIEAIADVLGTAITMERDYSIHVFDADKKEIKQ